MHPCTDESTTLKERVQEAGGVADACLVAVDGAHAPVGHADDARRQRAARRALAAAPYIICSITGESCQTARAHQYPDPLSLEMSIRVSLGGHSSASHLKQQPYSHRSFSPLQHLLSRCSSQNEPKTCF